MEPEEHSTFQLDELSQVDHLSATQDDSNRRPVQLVSEPVRNVPTQGRSQSHQVRHDENNLSISERYSRIAISANRDYTLRAIVFNKELMDFVRGRQG